MKIKDLYRTFKRELAVHRLPSKHPEPPRGAKILLGLAIGYLLLPFDFIPKDCPSSAI